MSQIASVGYAGQRYEVRFIAAIDGEVRTMGWCNAADGGSLLQSALLWPAVAIDARGKPRVWVVDLMGAGGP